MFSPKEDDDFAGRSSLHLLFKSLTETTLWQYILILWSRQKARCIKSKPISAFKLRWKVPTREKGVMFFCSNYLITKNYSMSTIFVRKILWPPLFKWEDRGCLVPLCLRIIRLAPLRTQPPGIIIIDWHLIITSPWTKKSLLFLSPMFLFLWD